MAQSEHLGGENEDMASLAAVDVMYDREAGVWVATSEELVGLVTEAPSIPALRDKLIVLIPELAELNGFELPRKVRLHGLVAGTGAAENGFADTTLAIA